MRDGPATHIAMTVQRLAKWAIEGDCAPMHFTAKTMRKPEKERKEFRYAKISSGKTLSLGSLSSAEFCETPRP